jgi:hypothetical protein
MTILKEQIEKHAEDFTYIDSETDFVVVGVGFVFTAYFWNGHKHDVRLAIAKCLNELNQAFDSPFKWGFDNDAGKFKDVKNIPDIYNYIKSMDEDDTLSYFLSSAENHESVGEYTFSCLTERGWMSNNLSVLKFSVPRDVVYDDSKFEILKNLILSFIKYLNPYHANAGFSVVSTYEETIWDGGKYDLATRYNTLMVEDFASDSIKSAFGIKSVNWLNFFSKKLAACIDEPKNIPAYFSKGGFKAQAVDGGFLTQTSEFPQITHISEPVPNEYLKMNALLRPLRIGHFGSMGSMSINGEIRFDEYTTDLWIRRLDGQEIWPPSLQGGVPSELPLFFSKSAKHVKSGEVCNIQARFRDMSVPFPDDVGDYDPANFVVLLPRDVAPFKMVLGPHGEFLGRVSVKWGVVQVLNDKLW